MPFPHLFGHQNSDPVPTQPAPEAPVTDPNLLPLAGYFRASKLPSLLADGKLKIGQAHSLMSGADAALKESVVLLKKIVPATKSRINEPLYHWPRPPKPPNQKEVHVNPFKSNPFNMYLSKHPTRAHPHSAQQDHSYLSFYPYRTRKSKRFTLFGKNI